MAPKRAASTEEKEAAPKKAKSDEPSPCDEYFVRLKNKITELGASGAILVKGISHKKEEEEEEDGDGDGDDDDDDEKRKARQDKFTVAQVAELRHIIVTLSREKALTAGTKFATGGQHKESWMTFNTHHGNTVIKGIEEHVAKAVKKKLLADRFDALYGLTSALKTYEVWMEDNEYGEEITDHVQSLAKAWKTLLAHSDAELGIDTEFTRPGIQSLLTDFAASLSDMGCQFKWK